MEGSKQIEHNALQLLNNARSRETAHRLDGLSLAKWNHVRERGTVASDLRKPLTLHINWDPVGRILHIHPRRMLLSRGNSSSDVLTCRRIVSCAFRCYKDTTIHIRHCSSDWDINLGRGRRCLFGYLDPRPRSGLSIVFEYSSFQHTASGL